MELHLGIFQRIIFALLKSLRCIQNFFSEVFWNSFGKILVFIAWKISGDEDHGYRRIIIKKSDKFRYFLGITIEKIMLLNGWLNGLKGHYSSYELLLRWNPRIPLIALKHNKTNYIMQRLGHERIGEPGIYPVENMSSFGTSDVYGHFMITDKKVIDGRPGTVAIDCIWLTGEKLGEKFTVDKFTFSQDRNQTLPDYIYFPPKLIVWLFEALILIGSATTFWSIIDHAWNYLDSIDVLPTLKSWF